MKKSGSGLIDGQHGTSVEVTVHGRGVPEGGIDRTKRESAGTNAMSTFFLTQAASETRQSSFDGAVRPPNREKRFWPHGYSR